MKNPKNGFKMVFPLATKTKIYVGGKFTGTDLDLVKIEPKIKITKGRSKYKSEWPCKNPNAVQHKKRD